MAPCTAAIGLLALLCIHGVAAQQLQGGLGRRGLLQAGPARFMNAPIMSETVFEAGPSPPKRRQPVATVGAASTSTQQQPQQLQPQQQQARGLLAANSHDHHNRYSYDLRPRSSRQFRGRRYSRYDRAALSPYIGGSSRYSGIARQPLPLLSSLLGGALLARGSNPRSAAQSLAQAYSGGRSDEAAQAVASAFAGDGSSSAQATAMAQAVTEMTVSNPNVAPGLLAKSANFAVTRGHTDRYANNLASAFGYAKQQQKVPQLTSAVCSSIAEGGDAARYATGNAIATAIAAGGDSKAAVAEATATALCEGGSTAQAWSSAYAVALSKDSNGCLVLNEAKAMAQARCGDGAAEAISNAESASNVLGFCGMLDGFPPDFSMSSGNGGSSATNGGWGQGSATGSGGIGGNGGWGQGPATGGWGGQGNSGFGSGWGR